MPAILSLLSLLLPGETVVADNLEEVELLGWTRSGSLAYLANGWVCKWPDSTRVAVKTRSVSQGEQVTWEQIATWTREPGGDRWLSQTGIYDGVQNVFTPHLTPYWRTTDSTSILFWHKGTVGELVRQELVVSRPTFWVESAGKKTKLSSQWIEVFGISDDGLYMTALRRGAKRVSILAWNHHGAQPRVVKTFTKPFDDHAIPETVAWNPKAKAFLFNLQTPGSPIPVLAKERFRTLLGKKDVFGSAKWLVDGSPMFLLWQFGWSGSDSYDEKSTFPVERTLHTRIELQDALTGSSRVLSLAKQLRQTPKYGEDEIDVQGGRSIDSAELDFSGHNLAMLVEEDGRKRIVVRKI